MTNTYTVWDRIVDWVIDHLPAWLLCKIVMAADFKVTGGDGYKSVDDVLDGLRVLR